MENIKWTDDNFKKNVASGILVVGFRKVISQLITTSSNIFLARILAPEIFGSFAIISFLILTAGLIVNLGLAPALIQTKGRVTKNHLRTMFTTLVIGSLAVSVVIYLLAPSIALFYGGKLGDDNVLWLRILAFGLVLNHSSFVSEILLERKLEYKKLALAQILTLLITQSVTVYFALIGFGVGSFVLGNLIGGVVNFIATYALSPWPIGIRLVLSDLKPYLTFGLNYQMNTLVGAINGSVIPLFVGFVSGPKAVGLINWAASLRGVGYAPFDVIEKIIFPAASRIQGNKRLLKSFVEKMVKFSCMLSFPLLASIFALAPSITSIIYTSVWLTGLTALYLSTIQGVFILLGAILIDVLLALGKAKSVRNISIFWAILQWVLTIPLVIYWNFNGAVLAGLLVSSTFFVPLRLVMKEIKFIFWPNVIPYLLYSLLSGALMAFLAAKYNIRSIVDLIGVATLGMIFYIGILITFEGGGIVGEIKRFKELIINEKAKV